MDMAHTRNKHTRKSRFGKGRTRRLRVGVGQKHPEFVGVQPSTNAVSKVKRYRKTPHYTHPASLSVADTKPNVYGKITAEWCGHCKSLAPVWETVKTKLPGCVDFSMDETEMDVKKAEFKKNYNVELPDVAGFPTIYKLDHSNKIAIYGGSRDADSIVSWVKS